MPIKCVGQRNVSGDIGRSSLTASCLGKGFAKIAIEANVPIVPTFLANQEEMRWNPILYFWNLFGLGRIFTYLVQLQIPLFSYLLSYIGMFIWFSVTWFQIPIPAKITLYIGDPVKYDISRVTADDVRTDIRSAFLPHTHDNMTDK